jgi:hypothetical protein
MNAHSELIREFAGSVVKRTIREAASDCNVYRANQRQGYLTGVLDCALKMGSITQEENVKALEAVQGACFDEIWW